MSSVRKYLETAKALPWILPGLFIAVWFTVSETGLVPVYLMPHPKAILQAMLSYIFADSGSAPYAGRFLSDFYASSVRVILGFLLAVVLGLPLGVLSGRISAIHRIFGMTVNALRAVPGICWLPLALVWFGIGIKTTVFLVATAAFPPIYLSAEAGACQVNPVLLQAGAMLGVSRIRGIFTVLLPAAMPNIVTGLRLGLGVSWAYLVLGELTGVPDGLGAIIMDARMLGRIDIVIVGIILIALIGRLSDSSLHCLMKCCFRSARRVS